MSDAQFSAELVQVFVQAGKDAPSPKQIQGVISTLADQPASRMAFLVTLRAKASRLKHPGILPAAVEGFSANWMEPTRPSSVVTPEARKAEEAEIERYWRERWLAHPEERDSIEEMNPRYDFKAKGAA